MLRFKIKKLILSALCLCVVSAVFSGTAVVSAAAATNLPPGFIIGDQDGIHVTGDGVYFIDARDLGPGDIITKTLTIQNLSQNDSSPDGKLPFQLTMRTEPLFSNGPVDLLDAVHLELKLDGKTIYSGRCRGDDGVNMIKNTLNLGEYDVGDRRVLDITLTVDINMQLFEEKSEADFKWTFYANRYENPDSSNPDSSNPDSSNPDSSNPDSSNPDSSKLDTPKDGDTPKDTPKTGQLASYWPFLLLVGQVLLLGIILALKKKRRE